jgi:hypothetical protein
MDIPHYFGGFSGIRASLVAGFYLTSILAFYSYLPTITVPLIIRELKLLRLPLQISKYKESEQYCALPTDHTLAMDRYG